MDALLASNDVDIGGLDSKPVPMHPSLSNRHTVDLEPDRLSDESRSSSLSDIEDTVENEQMRNNSHRMAEMGTGDSEAETEKIEDTPRKVYKSTNVIVSGTLFDKGPNKLGQSRNTMDELEVESFSDSVVSSPGATEPELSDPDVDLEGEHKSDRLMRRNEISGKKRKRPTSSASDSSEEDEQEQHLRKRTGSIKSDIGQERIISDEGSSDLDISREATAEPLPSLEEGEDRVSTNVLGDMTIKQDKEPLGKSHGKYTGTGQPKSRRSRQDALEGDQAIDRDERSRLEEAGDSEEEAQAGGDDVEDAEAVTKNEEEYAKKIAAMESLTALEKHFAALRDRLYDERIASINRDLAQLAGPDSTHPDYLQRLRCIQNYRDEKYDIEWKGLVYKIQALKRKSVAERSQIHSAYFQTVRDIRERHLERASESFYRIQRDRFKTDESISNYSIPFSTRRSQQITQQTAYNREVSILSGVAKFVGFPAAPELASARQSELEDDMEKMGIHITPSRPSKPLAAVRSRFSSALSRPAAEEQFFEQTPWANPQHPVHHQHIQRLAREASEQSKIGEPYITPGGQKRIVDLNAQLGSASTIPENPSAVASSGLNTPYGPEQDQVQLQSHQIKQKAHDTERRPTSENLPEQNGRINSSSPVDIRKYHVSTPLNSEGPPSETKLNMTGQGSGVKVTLPPTSRISLFSSPPGHGLSLSELAPRHQTESPMTLHQHGRESSIFAGAGFAKFGGR